MEGFEPRINVRVFPKVVQGVVFNDFRARYGLMPDGSEVLLGETVNMNLGQAADHYFLMLEAAGVDGARYVLPYRDGLIPTGYRSLIRVAIRVAIRKRCALAWRALTGRKTLRVEGGDWEPLPALPIRTTVAESG